MKYNFKNLVFEGGGVKGIAYVGALSVLEEKGILPQIERVAGTSAGSIVAALIAVGFAPAEIRKKLETVNFNSFKDDSFFAFSNIRRLLKKYGWFKGDYFKAWLEKTISEKVSPTITFAELNNLQKPSLKKLYIIGTDVKYKTHVVLSHETVPNMPILEAVRISMSIPLFFQAVNYKNSLFADGGIYYNYPINLFDDKKYLSNGRSEGKVYNKETLGFRVDSAEEIDNKITNESLPSLEVNSLQAYIQALIGGLIDFANKSHLSELDWHRTVYIDSLGISSTQFDLTGEQKNNLIEMGKEGSLDYFAWFDKAKGKDKPLNR